MTLRQKSLLDCSLLLACSSLITEYFVVLVHIHVIFTWDDITVGYHESSADHVENQSDLDEPCGVDWQLLVELCGLGVEFDQKELVNPIMKHVEDASERIKDRHASGEHHHTPEISVVLSIDVVT